MKGQRPIQYKPSLPEKNDNVSHNHPLKEFVILLGGVIILFLFLFWSLGLFVDLAVQYISPEKEGVLFAKVQMDWAKESELSSEKQTYLQKLTDSLRPCLDVHYPVRVRVIESNEANAFAFPGGTIVVYSGLLDKVQSENGLAFILAHELSHFKNRDHLRGLGRSVVLVALSSLLTGANSNITQAIAPVQLFSQAQYSQKRESAADQTALSALNCIYGHVGGAAEFFNGLLGDKNGFDVKALHFFTSHPELQERIENLDRLAQEMGFYSDDVLPLKGTLKN